MPNGSIHEACARGDLDAVDYFIETDPACVDADDAHQWRPVFHAALNRHEAVVRRLIEAGADLSAHDGYVMHYAGEVPGNQAVVTLLVQYGALDAHLRPANGLARQLLAAVFLNDVPRVRSLLLRHPALGETRDGRGDYPIHHAARNGATEIVQTLIDTGAGVNARGHDNNTVLYCAGGHGHVDTVRVLVRAGADVDARFTKDGKNLLEWLGQYPDEPGFTEVAAALRPSGA